MDEIKNKNKNNKKTEQQQQNKCSTSLVQRAFPLDNGRPEEADKGKGPGNEVDIARFQYVSINFTYITPLILK